MMAQPQADPELRPELSLALRHTEQHCNSCQRCVKECAFLSRHGSPAQIAANYHPGEPFFLRLPFECHLCGLCNAVCGRDVEPAHMFLEMRRQAVDLGQAHFPEHNGLRNYEARGTSKRFSWYSLPPGCTSVFFPGCALSGSRAQITYQVYDRLRQQDPTTGIVLDCCSKPSHDLGDEDHFSNMFFEMVHYLRENGVEEVLVACPNCQRMFTEYGKGLRTRTVYEHLDSYPVDTISAQERISIHDPCVSRFYPHTHKAVRSLLNKQGFKTIEPVHTGEQTLCCGEGAGVKSLTPKYSNNWKDKRLKETEEKMVSYCAACTARFSKETDSYHLLDLLFDREDSLSGKSRPARAPLTYFNRLRLKHKLQKETPEGAVTRERNTPDNGQSKSSLPVKLALLTLLIFAFVAVRTAGGLDILERDRLHELISSYSLMAPLVYMCFYAIAPVLFLPGLPIGIVGGILFGPFWGVVYTITSATVGACLAFLISRYLARDFVAAKLVESRWQQLNDRVEQNGWKIVALTRLIPLFPFNLLNYAFGLTPIRFSHYALATFIFMLPGTIAVVSLAGSLPELIKGELSGAAVIGAVIIIAVSIASTLYKRFGGRDRKL